MNIDLIKKQIKEILSSTLGDLKKQYNQKEMDIEISLFACPGENNSSCRIDYIFTSKKESSIIFMGHSCKVNDKSKWVSIAKAAFVAYRVWQCDNHLMLSFGTYRTWGDYRYTLVAGGLTPFPKHNNYKVAERTRSEWLEFYTKMIKNPDAIRICNGEIIIGFKTADEALLFVFDSFVNVLPLIID